MPLYAYAVLLAGWLIWMAPFVFQKRSKQKAQQLDRRARWGIVLVAVAFALLWQAQFWEQSLPYWRLAVAVVFFAAASVLSWTARRALGRHWRIDAGLDASHTLVTGGPYRFVRHPIYTSMLCLMLGMGMILTP
jgi:protein-S-isoprenylcysteine O-methyltransferase Ste14